MMTNIRSLVVISFLVTLGSGAAIAMPPQEISTQYSPLMFNCGSMTKTRSKKPGKPLSMVALHLFQMLRRSFSRYRMMASCR
jgi:hypothetical protein